MKPPRPGIKLGPSKYIRYIPNFLGNKIEMSILNHDFTKVVFKNLSRSIPNAEILNLCRYYGEVIGDVMEEMITIGKNKTIPNGIRYVHMKLFQGVSFRQFYQMEGPRPGDPVWRVTVNHPGQQPQCSNCLRDLKECLGQGVYETCKYNLQGRAPFAAYMGARRSRVAPGCSVPTPTPCRR